MSKSVSALLIKFTLTFGAAWIGLNMFQRNDVRWIFLAAALAFVANYLVADMIILPSRSNIMATAADVMLTFISGYVITLFQRDFTPTIQGLIVFALIVGLVEYFFHSYLMATNKVEPKNN